MTVHELEPSRLPSGAAQEGFRFVQRLIDDWHEGANRFDGPGEALFGAFSEGTLIAVCGLNRDPYAGSPDVGRIRHLYVLKNMRRRGVASALLERLLEKARGPFRAVRLRTDTDEASAFYERHGFTRVATADATHVKRFRAD